LTQTVYIKNVFGIIRIISNYKLSNGITDLDNWISVLVTSQKPFYNYLSNFYTWSLPISLIWNEISLSAYGHPYD